MPSESASNPPFDNLVPFKQEVSKSDVYVLFNLLQVTHFKKLGILDLLICTPQKIVWKKKVWDKNMLTYNWIVCHW